MIKWERKLVEFIEKHIPLLAVLFISGIALLLRRQNIWYHTEDYIFYFDSHANNTQSALYYLLVKLVSYGSDIPLHGIKWIAGMADFAVAFLCVMLCGRKSDKDVRENIKKDDSMQVKLFLLYGACLFAPVVYLRGCVWAQIDSPALALLLGAACVWEYFEQKGIVPALLLAGAGVALYPPFLLMAAGYCLCVKKQNSAWVKYLWLAVGGIAVILEMFSAMAVGLPLREGWLSLINWLTYHPHTGTVYKSLADWMWQQLLMCSYGVGVVSLMAAFCKKLPLTVVIVIHIILAICFGIALGW